MDIKRIGLIAKESPETVAPLFAELTDWCANKGIKLVAEQWLKKIGKADRFVARKKVGADCELMVVMGGDGTLLSAVQSESPTIPPLLGINLGHLGFLTEVVKDEMIDSLARVVKGDPEISERTCLDLSLFREKKKVQSWVALNDAVINKGALARIIRLKTCVDDGLMTTYRADGIIISTPTGSTAYAMAAGGPIVHPHVPAIIITPICPHTLGQRTMVLADSSALTVEVLSGGEEIYLTLDGQRGHALKQGDLLKVRRSERLVRLVRSTRRNHFDVLREKLKWGER